MRREDVIPPCKDPVDLPHHEQIVHVDVKRRSHLRCPAYRHARYFEMSVKALIKLLVVAPSTHVVLG
jgi:hypothetical protein